MLVLIYLGIVALIVLFVAMTYNRFINLKNGIESTLQQINVALKKRLDMIGQIVDATKGQMKFEKSTLTEVTKLRTQAAGNLTSAEAQKLAAQTSKLAGSIAIQVEAYPKLSSNENVKQLINSVETAEQEIAQLRYTYNNMVQEFNTKTETVPSNMIASMFGFAKTHYLKMQEDQAALDKRPDTSLKI